MKTFEKLKQIKERKRMIQSRLAKRAKTLNQYQMSKMERQARRIDNSELNLISWTSGVQSISLVKKGEVR